MPYDDLAIAVGAGIVFTSLTFVFITVLFVRYRRDQMKHEKAMSEMKQTYEQSLLETQLDIQEKTFANISEEIHDNIGQILSLAKLTLNTVGQSLPPPAEKKIIASKDLVAKAIHDLRNLSKSLNTDLIKEIGLYEIIQREILVLSKTGRYEINFTVDGEPDRFDKQKELVIFRIFQELTNNIIKHANASTINVSLKFSAHKFVLEVSDDGSGFDVSQLQNEGGQFGLGLRNMHKRAAAISANLTVSSAATKGTSVSIDLDLSNALQPKR